MVNLNHPMVKNKISLKTVREHLVDVSKNMDRFREDIRRGMSLEDIATKYGMPKKQFLGVVEALTASAPEKTVWVFESESGLSQEDVDVLVAARFEKRTRGGIIPKQARPGDIFLSLPEGFEKPQYVEYQDAVGSLVNEVPKVRPTQYHIFLLNYLARNKMLDRLMELKPKHTLLAASLLSSWDFLASHGRLANTLTEELHTDISSERMLEIAKTVSWSNKEVYRQLISLLEAETVDSNQVKSVLYNMKIRFKPFTSLASFNEGQLYFLVQQAGLWNE